MRFRLPAATRHPVALMGLVGGALTALLFLVLFLLDALGFFPSPYFGLLLFIAIPIGLLFCLFLVLTGVRLDARRRRKAATPSDADWPVIDLTIARHRKLIAIGIVFMAVNLVLLSMGSYGAVHYLEDDRFCGEVCHQTMEPQYVAHETGPHAKVACVACHVGPGVGALIESKMAGARQLYLVATRRVPKPIPGPARSLRPARDTCEKCHWAENFHGDEVRVFPEFANDEANTSAGTAFTLFVGGGRSQLGTGRGIHWHMNLDNEIEYIATDPKRENIPYVRLRDRSGNVREFVKDGVTPEQLAAGQRRRMDCMDCHSRPAHTFAPNPQRAVDSAIAQGGIPQDLPYIRREAIAAISQEYPNRDAALQAIAARLRDFYKSHPPKDGRALNVAIAGTQDVWARNIFPTMNVKWGTYQNQIGHVDAPGCFRCHDDEHKSRDGKVISQDCELCHREIERPAAVSAAGAGAR